MHRGNGLAFVVAGLCFLAAGASAQDAGTRPEQPVKVAEWKGDRPEGAPGAAAVTQHSDSSRVHRGNAAVMSNWEALRVGMTEEEVHTLLGSPARRQTLSILTYWYYDVGTAYIGPYVSFDDHQVYSWTAP